MFHVLSHGRDWRLWNFLFLYLFLLESIVILADKICFTEKRDSCSTWKLGKSIQLQRVSSFLIIRLTELWCAVLYCCWRSTNEKAGENVTVMCREAHTGGMNVCVRMCVCLLEFLLLSDKWQELLWNKQKKRSIYKDQRITIILATADFIRT